MSVRGDVGGNGGRILQRSARGVFVCVERHWVMAIQRLCMVVRVHVHITWVFFFGSYARDTIASASS